MSKGKGTKTTKKQDKLKYISERNSGYQVCLHVKDAENKARTVTRQAKTLAEAIVMRDELVRLRDIGAIDAMLNAQSAANSAESMTVSDAMDKWMREHILLGNRKESTISIYRQQIKRFLPYVGTMLINNIDKHVFKAPFLARNGKTSARYAYEKFYACFDWLKDQGIINTVPILQPCKIDFGETPYERRAFSRDEEDAFLKAAAREGKQWYYIFRLYFESTMRRGELTALRWQDVDFKQQTIHIQHNIAIVNDEGRKEYLSTPKNKQSCRYVRISSDVLKYLKSLHKRRKSDDDFIFKGQSIKYPWISPSTVGRQFAIIRDKAGLDKGLTLHCTRHTTASRMAEAGLGLPVIMSVGGWKSKSVPLDRYIHIQQNLAAQEMAKMF